MKLAFGIYSAFIFYLINFGNGAKYEYELLKLEIVTIDGKYAEQNITLKRISRGVYSMDISTTFLEDVPTNSEFEVQIQRSLPGNNQFTSSPLRIPKANLEKFVNEYYKKYLMEDVTKYSNLPVIEGEYKGPFPKGFYWIKDYIFNTDNFPGVNLGPGLYKGIALWYLDGKLLYKAEAVFKLLIKN